MLNVVQVKAVLLAAVLFIVAPRTEAHRTHVAATVDAIFRYAPEFLESPAIIAALAIRESNLVPGVVGKRGECGSMQVMGWHLRPKMRCEELQTPEGGIVGGLMALHQWKRHVKKGRPHLFADDLQKQARACYASGNWCAAADSERALQRVHASLKGAGEGFTVLSGALLLTL